MSHDVDERTETDSRIIEELEWGKYVTVRMQLWHHYIDRAKLTIVEGVYNKEELKEIVEKCDRADAYMRAGPTPPAGCPRHFTFTCRSSDLVSLAKDMLKLYKGYEKHFP